MFDLNSSLLNGSIPWDTNYARKYLKIPDDQLEKINKIPGWSKSEIFKKTSTENTASENIERQSIQRPINSTENILTSNLNISAKNNDNLKNQNCNSDLQSRQNLVSSLNEKELFLRNFSLSPLKNKRSSTRPLRHSSSLPDLHKKSLWTEVLSPNKSDEQVYSAEKDILSLKLAPLFKKNISNETYTISGDGLNRHKLVEISHKSSSCSFENQNQLSKFKFKSMDDSILNHKDQMGTVTSAIKSNDALLISKETVKLVEKMTLLDKKLLGLEKWLSPSKEMNPPPFNSKLLNVANLNREKILNTSCSPAVSDEVTAASMNSDSGNDVQDKIQNSSVSKIPKNESFELKGNLQSLSEKSKTDTMNESVKDRAGDVSKSAVSNFESFASLPLPCRQPEPTDGPSPSELMLSQKSAELNTQSKLQNASTSVPSGQPIEALYLSQTIMSQKLAKLNAPSKPQNAEMSGNITALEKPSSSFNVFSANSNEKVSDLTPEEKSGTKRKRKTRSEKPSKKLDVKKLKINNIQFSSMQIKSMTEIMKIFHTEF